MSIKPKTKQEAARNPLEATKTTNRDYQLADDTDTGGTKPEGQTQPSREDDEEEVKRNLHQINQYQKDNPKSNVSLTLNIKEAFLIFN